MAGYIWQHYQERPSPLLIVAQRDTSLRESIFLLLSRFYIVHVVTILDFMTFLSLSIPKSPIWTPKPTEIVL